mgnify:CR=1 FL=1
MQDRIDRKSDFESMSHIEVATQESKQSSQSKLKHSVLNGNHAILCGPPGTGKSRAVELLLKDIENEVAFKEIVQFHPSYSYQDFVEGYTIDDGKYVPSKGLLFRFIEETKDLAPEKLKLLIIDEINRGDIPSIFGELMLLLDRDNNRTVNTSKFGNQLSLPDNFVIIGTMNTADRSIKQLDLALRRRFKFIFVAPDYEGLTEWLNGYTFTFDNFEISDYVGAIKKLNERITKHPLLGKNMTLGQSIFVPNTGSAINLTDLTNIFNEIVLPQLEAYIGMGNRKELDELFGTPEVRKKLDIADNLTEQDLINLINLLVTAQE